MSAPSTTALLLDRVAQDSDAGLFAIPDSFGGWFDLSAAEFLDRVRALSKGLLDAGLDLGDRLGVLSSNRFEATLVDFAAGMIGVVVVPLTRDASQEQLLAVLDDAGVRAIVVETARDFARFDELHGDLPAVDNVWQIALNGLDKLALAGRSSVSDDELDSRISLVGAETPLADHYFEDSDGILRRVTLTHGIAVARAEALADVLEGGAGAGFGDVVDTRESGAGVAARGAGDGGRGAVVAARGDGAGVAARGDGAGVAARGAGAVVAARGDGADGRGSGVDARRPGGGGAQRSTLLVLPAVDVISRITTLVAVAMGARIGHLSDPAALLRTLAGFRPTLLVARPALFEEIDRAARERAQAAGRGAALRQALDVAQEYAEALDGESVPRGLRTRFALADALVLRGLRKAAGGRLVDAVSIVDEASLPSRLRMLMRALDARPLEAYGAAETAGIAVIERRDDPFKRPAGTVGAPLPGVTASVGDGGVLVLSGAGVGIGVAVGAERGRQSDSRGARAGASARAGSSRGAGSGQAGSGRAGGRDGGNSRPSGRSEASARSEDAAFSTGVSAEIGDDGRVILLDRDVGLAVATAVTDAASAEVGLGAARVGDSPAS